MVVNEFIVMGGGKRGSFARGPGRSYGAERASRPGLFDRVVNRISRPSLRIRRNDDRRVRSRSADRSTSQMIIKGDFRASAARRGPMRRLLFGPAPAGRYPGILLYSEIY